MVEGNFLMRDGSVLVMNESSVLSDAEMAAKAAWDRLLSSNKSLPTLRH